MLLQVLRTLEGFATEVAFVRFQGYVDTDMRGDMVALDGGGTTIAPLASQVKVVRTLATDMTLANMVLDEGEISSIITGSSRWVHSRKAAPRSTLSLHSHSTDIAKSRGCRSARAPMVPAAVAAAVVVAAVVAAAAAAAAAAVAVAVAVAVAAVRWPLRVPALVDLPTTLFRGSGTKRQGYCRPKGSSRNLARLDCCLLMP